MRILCFHLLSVLDGQRTLFKGKKKNFLKISGRERNASERKTEGELKVVRTSAF